MASMLLISPLPPQKLATPLSSLSLIVFFLKNSSDFVFICRVLKILYVHVNFYSSIEAENFRLLVHKFSDARIRSEVLSPFRSLRMFFYLAFIASGALGGLIATTQLIASLTNPARSSEVSDTLTSLGIDIGAVSIFAFLYFRENTAKNAQLARLSREESLSNLKLCVNENKIIPRLLEREVPVVHFATDGNSPSLDFDESEDMKEITAKRKRLWQLTPVYVSEWTEWLNEQKKLAGVSPETPVYLSLRLDGRVRGSGVGYPPWNAFVAQLPPVKGLWSGLLDGMDGRVL
ncbi:hypothetical protein GQ457_02G004250 [Hibiscus cannabinus]